MMNQKTSFFMQFSPVCSHIGNRISLNSTQKQKTICRSRMDIFANIYLQTSCFFTEPPISLAHFLTTSAIIVIILYYIFRFDSIYLLDFACYQPPDSLRGPLSSFIEYIETGNNQFDRESIDFQKKVMERSGIGEEACVPMALHQMPVDFALNPAIEEVEEVLYPIVNDLLSKHKINPKSIDILVSNCSLFCPTPSITTMVVNKFGFRSNIKSVSLGGMGCSAGMLSISLVKDLLKVHKNSLALVLSLEVLSQNGYAGRNKSMLVSNTIFRMGGAAVLLSNKKQDWRKAKYYLQHIVRTNMGSDDNSYRTVYQQQDEEGFVGVLLLRAILHTATNALKKNLSELGPRVLPYSEQLRFVGSVLRQKLQRDEKLTPVPNFKKAFEHFCIHAGGRAIIDAVEQNLKLEKEDTEASRMTLYRFGNTSSSSLWYSLCYLEAKGKMKRGDQVWQLAFGSGFKCNSAVWKCISDIDPKERNAWSDRIHRYPC